MSSMQKIFDGYSQRLAVLENSSNPLAKGVAWVAGELVPFDEARVPLQDQGFMHSDLTYDVPSVWDGRFFRLDDHLTRIEKSCTKMRMRFPIPREDIKSILCHMVAESGIRDAYVEIIVTRGLRGIRESLQSGTRPEDLQNALYMFVTPYIWVMNPKMQLVGGDAIIARTTRRIPTGSFDPTIKNLQWGDLTRAMLEAIDRGATYPFLTDGDTNLTEGSGFNIVLIKDGALFTPDRGVLEGVTRKSVMEIARAHGIPVRMETVPVALAYECEEIFMCTTAGGIMPIVTLDGRPVNDGRIGNITRTIWDAYWVLHYDPNHSFKVDYHDQPASARPNTSEGVVSKSKL